MYQKPFRYTKEEALIVAKWEIGVCNYVKPIVIFAVSVIICAEAVRFFLKMPIAPISVYIADIVAVFCFMLSLNYINKRISMTAKEIIKREFAVDFDFKINGILVSEYGVGVVYKALFSDIVLINVGKKLLRINSKYGAICLPCSQVPEEFILRMQQQPDKKSYRVYKWM